MKRILLSAGILISLSAAAQDNTLVENYFNRQLKSRLQIKEVPHIGAIDCLTGKIIDTDIRPIQPVTSLGGEEVVILPQDGMPCIQPDLDQFNMPNAGAGMKMRRSGAGVIPNPGSNSVTLLPKSKTTLMTKP